MPVRCIQCFENGIAVASGSTLLLYDLDMLVE